VPDFDAGFMNDERDMAPMVWGYIKSRETARRMDCYAGELQAFHPVFDYDSEARAYDLNLEDTNKYALPGNVTAGIQHGSWSVPVPEPDEPVKQGIVTSNHKAKRKDLKYSKKDIEAVEEWVKRHVETTWHCLGVSHTFTPFCFAQKKKKKRVDEEPC
jgi:alcohol oxidase